jgi:hypothetical protein
VPISPSPSFVRGPRRRAGLVLAGSALALLALAGCSAASSTPTASPTDTATSAPTESATPTPTSTPTPEAAGTRVTLTYGTAPDYKPAAGSAAATAKAYQGVACGWLNQTSGDIVEVSIAQPNDTLMTDLQNKAVTESNPVPTYGTPPAVLGYFSSAHGAGQAQAFAGKYWVVVNSVEFGEPGDAEQLMAAVLSHLK